MKRPTARAVSRFVQVPPGGITSAVVNISLNTLGSLQDTDATVMAVGAPYAPCEWAYGGMPGCVVLHGGFEGKHRSLTLNLLDIACDASIQGSPEAQQLVRDQLQTGVVHMLLEDDTAVYSAQLVLNGESSNVTCGASEQPAQNPPPTTDSGTALAGDDFNRPDGERCQLGSVQSGSRKLYYLPIFPSGGTDPTNPIGANLVSGALQNNGADFGGFQFTEAPDPCRAGRGADMGQDLNIRADLLTPTDAAGHISQAGPYFRSRAAARGDGIIGGDSAGYWVQLASTGEIQVKRLNPWSLIATSGVPASFDPSVMHHIETAAGGNRLQVALDGKLQTFMQNNEPVTTVQIPATAGSNNGTAGIAFGAEANRGQIGGQRADNVVVLPYHSLDGLPVQNNFAAPPTATHLPPTARPPTATLVPPTATNVPPTPTVAPPSAFPTALPTTASPSPTFPMASPTFVTPTAFATPTIMPTGDCNGDGVTELDALCALEMSVLLLAPNPLFDIDGNGVVDSRDAVLILQRAVNK
ncbi:MAG: hypothetical protein HY741_01695 [Chloroflexi bacterium]|nr:hypothetical protein [Chloroflexota bacterium]